MRTKMEWKECDCPICKKSEIKRKELSAVRGFKTHLYKCDNCGKISVNEKTLELKEDFIKKNQELISRYIREITDENYKILEIELTDKNVKEENQITFEQIVERQQEKEGS